MFQGFGLKVLTSWGFKVPGQGLRRLGLRGSTRSQLASSFGAWSSGSSRSPRAEGFRV